MLDEKQIELIQADVDGELSEQHRVELSRFLLANPEARALRDELRRTCAMLDRIPSAEPPAGLRESILGSVRTPLLPKRGWIGHSGLRAFWNSTPMLRFAAVFAGGLIVGSLAFELGSRDQGWLDLSQVAGTMAGGDPAATSAPIDAVQVGLEQVSGTVRLFQSSQMRVVEFDLVARGPLEVVVAQDGQEAKFSGFGRHGAGGAERYALVLDGPGTPGSPIGLKFVASGTVIHEDVLEVPAPQ